MTRSIASTLPLSTGGKIPILGLGVYLAGSGDGTRNAVRWALDAGYRHVDTATFYHNEREVGEAVRAAGIPRGDVFVTTKLWNSDHGYDAALRAFEASNKRLGLEYVDLYLIHWPVAKLRDDSWRALETLYEQGRCRSIGVSNYTVRHLEELLGWCRVKPSVNQVEFSPFLDQGELLDYCRSNDIVLEAYSPLTKGERVNDPTATDIGRRHGKTAAQVLIRWAIQRGVVVIPKSSRKERIEENADVFDFELSDKEMSALGGLHEDYRTTWDPTDAP